MHCPYFFEFGLAPLRAGTRLSYRSLSLYRTLVNCRNIPTCNAAASIHIAKRCIFSINVLYSFSGNVALRRSAAISPLLLLLLFLIPSKPRRHKAACLPPPAFLWVCVCTSPTQQLSNPPATAWNASPLASSLRCCPLSDARGAVTQHHDWLMKY